MNKYILGIDGMRCGMCEAHDHYGVWSFVIGFVVMLALDCIQF